MLCFLHRGFWWKAVLSGPLRATGICCMEMQRVVLPSARQGMKLQLIQLST